MDRNKRAVAEETGDVALKKHKPETEDAQREAHGLIDEKVVGITGFINKSQGFLGLLKQRYSDFLVNEVDLNGNVIHLLDEGIDLGKTKKERQLERRQKERADLQDKSPEEIEQIKRQKREEAENKPKYELTQENRDKLLEHLSEAELQSIEDLFTHGGHTETKTTFPDKPVRGTLHKLLREAFQGKLETVTSPENTFRIEMARHSGGNRRKNPMESINHVDENGVINYGLGPFKPYLHFTVYKENRETMEVASTISKLLRVPSKSIRFSGTKDRRGVTCQRFSLHKGKVARVSQINKGLKSVVLGSFTYEDNSLDLGDLMGNEFLITIRDVKPASNDTETLEALVESGFNSLKTNGFINYYGMQRFGTFSVPTFAYGIKLLKDDWKGAVELLLSPQEVVVPDSQESRKIWAETRDPELALQKMPARCNAECSVLKSLKNETRKDGEYDKQSYFKSIMAIPRNLRIMYVHSYQSYIWNKVASKRIELFGLNVVEGDLVIVPNESKPVETDENGDAFEEDTAGDKHTRARPLTKEDIDGGKYSINDIVLPTPGFDIIYPSHKQLEQVYVEEMAKDGLDPYKMARRIREFSLSGSYRKLMGKPGNMDYKVVKYTEATEPLVRTDHEILQAQKNGESLDRYITNLGDRTAVILKMQLGVSSYATMALREFMKIDTSRFSDSFNVSVE